jgi:transcriptional regulator with XRE-family HTH domain
MRLSFQVMRPRPQPSQAPAPEQVLTKATVRAAGLLGLSDRELARVLGVSPASVSRLEGGRTIDPAGKEGELALLLLRVYRGLDALFGGDGERTRAWLRATNDHLGGVPAELVSKVSGLVAVAEYLDAIRSRS